ncbi:flagellar assembly factor FliW [Paenibacillus marchantiophytorum]|uniref:Flagellar assembly factor FliW n=1 Tax=Paenibacillus marchantiophytorum TaxID=1619310 RepID=A0ABQ1F242_9BACL|nr:flagellar assembly protein FliW [Paenibacillus marchantiophytorum]GFZ97638.1 flagellar assembly factor FliW [Paenibacillus marchantiophytorum]
MKISTLFFGELEVIDEEIVTFTQGVPGFEELTQFTLVQPEDSAPFSYIQSVQEGDLSFVVTDPFLFFKDYDISLPEALQAELKIEQPEDVLVWTVVTVNHDFSKITLNLLAPIIWNVKTKMAKQIILHDSEYNTKHEIVLNADSDEASEPTQVEG